MYYGSDSQGIPSPEGSLWQESAKSLFYNPKHSIWNIQILGDIDDDIEGEDETSVDMFLEDTFDYRSSRVETEESFGTRKQWCELTPPPSKVSKPVLSKLTPKKDQEVQVCSDNSESTFTGALKFFLVKKQYGFIKCDSGGEDVFLCQDELKSSNINYRNFKRKVLKNQQFRFSFKKVSYQENGKEKIKATDIKILT